MRRVALSELLAALFATEDGERERQRLFRAHLVVAAKDTNERQKYINDNGSEKWRRLKNLLTTELGKKCWYTEIELAGTSLTIDHYRPKIHYWWLAFDAMNYRVACSFSNSPARNVDEGHTGGKGDSFPLLGSTIRARGKNALRLERPVILDPCVPEDCDLVAFQADGRPVINPNKAGDQVARDRFEQSKVLLNLDHPDFNTRRERLYQRIHNWVLAYEELPKGASSRALIRDELRRAILPNAEFSSAARHYVRAYRHLEWIQELLDAA